MLGSCESYQWQPEYYLIGDVAELEAQLLALGSFEGTAQELAAECGRSTAWMSRRMDALKRYSRQLTVTYSTDFGEARYWSLRGRAKLRVIVTPRGSDLALAP